MQFEKNPTTHLLTWSVNWLVVQLVVVVLGLPTMTRAQRNDGQSSGSNSSAIEVMEDAHNPQRSAYVERVADGVRRAAANRLDDAREALQEAIDLDAERPEAYLILAQVQRMQGTLGESLSSFQRALERADSAAFVHAAALQGVAETLERLASSRPENAPPLVAPEILSRTRDAWQAALAFAEEHRDLVNPEIARARLAVVERVLAQEQADQLPAVRERIAARESMGH